jgi:hypothetical protein
MLHLNPAHKLFISEDLIGYSDKLTEDGTFPRRIDLLLLGFSYAVNERLDPAKEFTRHELHYTSGIDEKTRLTIEAVAQWYARERGMEDRVDTDRQLLEFICGIGITGVKELQRRWEGKRRSQIQWDILQLLASITPN